MIVHATQSDLNEIAETIEQTDETKLALIVERRPHIPILSCAEKRESCCPHKRAGEVYIFVLEGFRQKLSQSG